MSSTREQLIKLLSHHANTFVSGQWLSDQLSISRTAVWKQIKQLVEDGYRFESVPNKGYRLTYIPDKVSKNTVYWGLKTKSIGKKIEHYDQIESTQTLAIKRAQEGCDEGLVIIAEKQIAGRGRRARHWDSNHDKGVWLSLVLRPDIIPIQSPQLTLLTATVLLDVIEEITQLKPEVKWPNDILINGKKVAGILTQAQAEHDQVHYAVIGIGLNVNQEKNELTDPIKHSATSLKIETSKSYSKQLVIQTILNRFEEVYFNYLKDGFKSIKTKWLKSAYRLGERLEYSINDEVKSGVFIDLSDDGCLIIENDDRQQEKLYTAKIHWF